MFVSPSGISVVEANLTVAYRSVKLTQIQSKLIRFNVDFLLHRECPEEKAWFSPQTFPRGEFYGYEPTAYSPRSHNSPQADTVELTATQI